MIRRAARMCLICAAAVWPFDHTRFRGKGLSETKGVRSMMEALKELEPKLKEVLYRFLEEVRATKAALYLGDDREGFDLITQYGFRDSAVGRYAGNDELVDRLITKRAPFFINGLTADPRFSELLYNSDTSRLLVAPIYSRGKLVGFVDLRDKARQAPFDNDDVKSTQKIVDDFLELFAERRLFGQAPQTASGQVPLPQQERTPTSPGDVPIEIAPLPTSSSALGRTIDDAKAIIARGALRPRAQNEVVTERHLNAAALALPAIISLPGVVLASVSPISRLGGTQVVAARSEVSPAAMEQLDAKVRAWLKKRGESGPVAARTNSVYPFGTAGVPIAPERMVSVLSAPVRTGAQDGLVLTVAFEMMPDAASRSNLEKLLANVQQLVSLASTAESASSLRQQVAEKLLEPDFQKYPALVTHSKRVADLAERLAQFVNLSDEEVENIRLAALLHDVGMRLIDYKGLYRKSTLSSDDLRLMRSHPTVSAALVAESALGPEIAAMILSHHERPDGQGYPDGLAGDRIPLGSRIIHICEAFDAMTSTDSYQPPVQPNAAVGKIRRSAGTQFDAELTAKFAEMLGLTS